MARRVLLGLVAVAVATVAVVLLAPKDSLPQPLRRIGCKLSGSICRSQELFAAVDRNDYLAVKQLLQSGTVDVNARREVRGCGNVHQGFSVHLTSC